MKEEYSIWEASCFLAKHLPQRTARQCYGYLMQNPHKYLEQDGYRITTHVVNGERRYTKAALLAYVHSHTNQFSKSHIKENSNE